MSLFDANRIWALAATLIWFTGACASPQAIHRAGTSSTASEAAEPTKDQLVANAGKIELAPTAAPTDRGNTSLDFARTVLEHKAGRKLNSTERERVARILVDAETEHGLPVILSLAIIELESSFNPSAKGPAGSLGLMQLQPATAREMAMRRGIRWKNWRTLLDPEQNTRLGIAYLAEMRAKFGTIEHALAAYNIGPGNLRRLLARRPLTRGPYLTKVYAHVDALRRAFGDSPISP